MIYALLAVGAAAAAYQLLALAAALLRKRGQTPFPEGKGVCPLFRPPVSILKPVHGLDPDFYEAIRSHAVQQYPEFEIIFGVGRADDPAIRDIERLQAEYPAVPIRLVRSAANAPNHKAGVLADLAAAARYPVLLVNDSDIRVPRDYLARVAAPLEDPAVGMVTCLYRARARGWAGRFEAVGIATDFAPSVLVAPLVGVSEFALGSTMVFRAADLARIGGFAAIADYIADDYQLSRRIRALGRRVVISKCVVETSVPDSGWRDMWRHQLRWARTIRLARGGGYAGLPVANATLWAVLLAAAGAWWAALPLFALRTAAGLAAAVLVLGDRRALKDAYLIPFRDLTGVALWACGLFGSEVVWRDARLRLDREGRIVKIERKPRELEVSAGTR
ncbi:MAG: bacteriohopanetetrol glucosamine biosynthesis glycosyltransferase HpnI [Acidobacteriota bacterium]